MPRLIEKSAQASTAWYNLWFSESLFAGHIQLADNETDFKASFKGTNTILVSASAIELLEPIDESIKLIIGECPIDVATPFLPL